MILHRCSVATAANTLGYRGVEALAARELLEVQSIF
jgi:hypothetical protein